MTNYLVATIRPWNVVAFHEKVKRYPGAWYLIERPEDLTVEALARLRPRYVFFPHWSAKVPQAIYEHFECVCFHEADLPFGRGGSPIQNLIARGHTETQITALRMTGEFDAGDVYLKRPLSLLGAAEEIYLRSAAVVAEMIGEIITQNPRPVPQVGEASVFKRRVPAESRITGQESSLNELFDKIRMLDAEGYPRAYIEIGNYKFVLKRAALRTGCIEADVTIESNGRHHDAI